MINIVNRIEKYLNSLSTHQCLKGIIIPFVVKQSGINSSPSVFADRNANK